MGNENNEPVKQKRNRKPNLLTTYQKAHALAERARKAHAKAEALAAKAKESAEKAAELASKKDEYEAAEQVALAALKAEVEGLDTDTDAVEGVEE